ncbi:MAG: succinate dehydrogenase assembly factor 2 [Gallionella sp.]
MKNLERVRWRCRRGLLELDIVLGRFIDMHYVTLNEIELKSFEELLDMPDNPLWDLVSGKADDITAEQRPILEKLRSV